MFSFYNVIGRLVRPACLIALLVTFTASSADAQVSSNIAFPEFAHARSIVFVDDGGSEVQLVGTHSYGLYRSVPGAIGKNKWTDPSGLSDPITVNDVVEINTAAFGAPAAGSRLLLGASGSGGHVVMCTAKEFMALRRSNRAKRAPYNIFMYLRRIWLQFTLGRFTRHIISANSPMECSAFIVCRNKFAPLLTPVLK